MDKEWSHILKLIKRGTDEDLRQAAIALGPRLFSLALEITGNREEAQEVTSDILMKVFDRINSFDPAKASFSTWVLRIARNMAISSLRHRQSQPEKCDIENITSALKHSDNKEDENTTEVVAEALSKCSRQERELINLYYYDGIPLKEISSITGIAPGTLAVRLQRIRQKIRNYIEHSHG